MLKYISIFLLIILSSCILTPQEVELGEEILVESESLIQSAFEKPSKQVINDTNYSIPLISTSIVVFVLFGILIFNQLRFKEVKNG
jgi:hypothetical protein